MSWSKAKCKFCGSVVAEREEPVQYASRTLILIEDLRCLACAESASNEAARKAKEYKYRAELEAELNKYIEALGPGAMVELFVWHEDRKLHYSDGRHVETVDGGMLLHVELKSAFGVLVDYDELVGASHKSVVDLAKCGSPPEEARRIATEWNAELKHRLDVYAKLATFNVGGEP